jgi:hypothetical protein
MSIAPGCTLNANLDTIIGGAATGGYLRVTLCGYGARAPAVPGTCMLADAGVPQLVGPQVGSAPLSVVLFGNDVITPANTFYEISVLDSNKDVVQSGNYQFTGTAIFDLSTVFPILPPYGFPLAMLAYQPCTLGSNNHSFTAPGPVIAPAYNGVLLPEGASSPTLSYTLDSTGTEITLNFDIDPSWERIDAFCLV